MNKTTLGILEYHKIIEMLEEFTVSDMGRDLVRSLEPETDAGVIRHRLMETSESRGFAPILTARICILRITICR